MFGKNIVLVCPYCNQVIDYNIGVTHYYKYNNKTVIVRKHCDKEFVCEPSDLEEDSDAPSRSYRPYLWELIDRIFKDYYSDDLPVETITNNITEKIKKEYNIDPIDYQNLQNISLYVVKRRRSYSHILSVPFTRKIKRKLKPYHTLCY